MAPSPPMGAGATVQHRSFHGRRALYHTPKAADHGSGDTRPGADAAVAIAEVGIWSLVGVGVGVGGSG